MLYIIEFVKVKLFLNFSYNKIQKKHTFIELEFLLFGPFWRITQI